jgi:hypothetical protein
MKFLHLIRSVVGIILLCALAAIVLSKYAAGTYLAVGVVVLVGFSLSIRFWGWKNTLIITFTAIPVLLIAFTAWIIIFRPLAQTPFSACKEGEVQTVKEITRYTANVEPKNFSEGSFLVTEHVTYNELENTCVQKHWESKLIQENLEQELPGRTIQSVENGLFVHEVLIPVELTGYQCCPATSSVVIKNIPYNSFYDAQYADSLKVDEYLGNSTITWQTPIPYEGLRFAYLPSPFHNLRVLVTPFIELSKYNNWILAIFGFAISSIFLLVIKPNVIGFINDKAKKAFNKGNDSSLRKPPKRRLNRN